MKKFPLSNPLFLKADGDILTFQHFNSWTGDTASDQVSPPCWGRWTSSVCHLYANDISKRMELQRSLLKVMDQIKAHIEGAAPSF